MLEAPAVYASVADLIAGATDRSSLTEGAGKSGARLERIVIGGQPYVLKHLDLAEDWTMRASGCLRGAPPCLSRWRTPATQRAAPKRTVVTASDGVANPGGTMPSE